MWFQLPGTMDACLRRERKRNGLFWCLYSQGLFEPWGTIAPMVSKALCTPTRALMVSMGYRAEETIHLIVDACSEEERVSVTRQATITEAQSPQVVNRNWITLLIFELTAEGTRIRFKGIDATITKIANQHVLADHLTQGAGSSFHWCRRHQQNHGLDRTSHHACPVSAVQT